MSGDEEGPISPNLFPNGPHLVLCGVVEGSMCRRCVVVSRAALGGVDSSVEDAVNYSRYSQMLSI